MVVDLEADGESVDGVEVKSAVQRVEDAATKQCVDASVAEQGRSLSASKQPRDIRENHSSEHQ